MLKKVCVVLGLLASTSAFSGEATIPWWKHHSEVSYCVTVSNVTAVDMNVTINLYKEDGTLYTGSFTQTNGATINQAYSLPGNTSSEVCLTRIGGASHFGYGVIKGEPAQADAGKGLLVANAFYADVRDYDRWVTVPVNGGLPF